VAAAHHAHTAYSTPDAAQTFRFCRHRTSVGFAIIGDMRRARVCSLVAVGLLAGGLTGCTGSTPRVSPTIPASHSPRPTNSPRSTAAIVLRRQGLLGATFLAPVGWPKRGNTSLDQGDGLTDGFRVYLGPDGEAVYVEINASREAYCDTGIVTTGVANGVPDPVHVSTMYGATNAKQISFYPLAAATFSDAPPFTYLQALGVRWDAEGQDVCVTYEEAEDGYVIIEAFLPASLRPVATEIVKSLTTPAPLD
jgi:hypothetical protein